MGGCGQQDRGIGGFFLMHVNYVFMMFLCLSCFFMMFLADFWLQPWMNRWFAGNEELPMQANKISMRLILILCISLIWCAMNRFLCNWFFISMLSWANRVNKKSFGRLLYISIYYWTTFYTLLEHNFIHRWSTFLSICLLFLQLPLLLLRCCLHPWKSHGTCKIQLAI